ncbi:hypothetical protein Ahy_B09g097817 [Arachis hypogaea]|uniref:SWIM-type domain-containing protein n=1 Tax=Arachis hypogaea TaxID=3818 RepID=A0A444XQG5_ARAHY|nr:hypothetical protein Ahy_B09g097817 [Arachis hypogaea]
MDVSPFMRSLDLDTMRALEFPEYANIGVADPEDGKFRIGIEYSSRKLVIAAIRSYNISRGVDYTFYAKFKTYGRGCDWLIRVSLIQKKVCWEIRRYNVRHTCSMETISQDHSKRNEVFEVHKMPSRRVLVVDFAWQMCDCGHFQVERLPCRHVISYCANQRLNWQVYVNNVYKMLEIQKIYIIEFVLLGDMETWPNYPRPTVVTNPTLIRTVKGHSKSTCYLNEMDSRKMRGPSLRSQLNSSKQKINTTVRYNELNSTKQKIHTTTTNIK